MQMADSGENEGVNEGEDRTSDSKRVLVCFKKRKRSIRFNSDDNQCDSKVLEKRIKEEFKDCLPAADSPCEMFLQVKDKTWDEFVDVMEGDKIEDKSVIQIILDEVKYQY